MKTAKFLLAVVAMLLIGANSVSILAQTHIEKIVKELEGKGVDVNTIVKRNEKKQVWYQAKTLTFRSKEGNYAKQLERAFDQDADNASSVSKDKKSNRTAITLVFEEDKKKSLYTLKITGDEEEPRVQLSILFRDGSVEGADKDKWIKYRFDYPNGFSYIFDKTGSLSQDISLTLNELPDLLDFDGEAWSEKLSENTKKSEELVKKHGEMAKKHVDTLKKHAKAMKNHADTLKKEQEHS